MKKYLYIASLISILGIVVIKGINYGVDRYACHSKWVESNIEYKYSFRGGCLLQRDGAWLPADNFRVE